MTVPQPTSCGESAPVSRKQPPPRVAEFDPGSVRDVSEAVYRERVGCDDIAKMVEKNGEAYVRRCAGAYDALTRAYMRALGNGR